MLIVVALLAVTSVPMLPAQGGALHSAACPLCHMAGHVHNQAMTSAGDSNRTLSTTMQHARIEYCGHHDIGGLPQLLAPHVVSLDGFVRGLTIVDMATEDAPVLKPRLLPFPVPPPRIS